MRIKDLDRNEVYDLTEIKKDAVKFDMLKEWLEKNCHKWNEYKSTRLHIWDSLKYNLAYKMWYMSNGEPTKCALTLFDLDITDYQVDCSELSDVEINNLVTGLYGSKKATITYDKFMELFEKKIDNLEVNQGYKETQDKCNYELDFDFIRDLAMRIQNEGKYEPYNWQKPMNIEQLSNAMLRHAIEVKKGNFEDNGELGHLLAIACNAMFIYHQKKHHND